MSEGPEHVVATREIYKGKIVHLRVEDTILANGVQALREIVSTPGSVVIVPLTADGQVRLIRQYRSAVRQYLLELPAGLIEPHESPEEAARRELEEETGDRAGSLEKLAQFYALPGICDEMLHLFVARDLSAGQVHPDADECIEIQTFPVEQALQMVRQGEICDGKTMLGLLLATCPQ